MNIDKNSDLVIIGAHFGHESEIYVTAAACFQAAVEMNDAMSNPEKIDAEVVKKAWTAYLIAAQQLIRLTEGRSCPNQVAKAIVQIPLALGENL